MKRRLVYLSIFLCTTAHAIETTEVRLRDGETDDGAVRIWRDGEGRLLLDDATTEPTTLEFLLSLATDHSALVGLDGDDHPQYLTTGRHADLHDAEFNGDLPIPADAGGNETLGDHVTDGDVHLGREEDESIGGAWNFADLLTVRGVAIRLGLNGGSLPTLRMEDEGVAGSILFDGAASRFRIDRPLDGRIGGTRMASLEGFASIEGIAPADLLASTRAESVSAAWTFLAGARVDGELSLTTARFTALPSTRFQVRNGGSAISAGMVVVWSGIGDGMLEVAPLATAVGWETPYAGIAVGGAATGVTLSIATGGVATVLIDENVTSGTPLTWSGTGAVPADEENGLSLIGHALEDAEAPGTVRLSMMRLEGVAD